MFSFSRFTSSDPPTPSSPSSPERTSSGHAQVVTLFLGGTTPTSVAQAQLVRDDDDEDAFVDEFGFVLTDQERTNEQQFVRSIDGKQVLRREVKWARMTEHWEKTLGKHFGKMKDRVRKGIPSKLRGIAWQLLVGSRRDMDSNPGVFRALMEKPLNAELEGMIGRDLGRTFPSHLMFRDTGSAGQRHLKNILHAYASIDPEVGYVQGMGFVVGALLTQMGEEEAFWCLHGLMHGTLYRMRDMYRPGFPALQCFFFQLKHLIKQHLPALYAHFEAEHVDVSFFAAQWFMTLYVYHFTFRAVLRVWDIFVCEGWKIIFRVGIALMKWEEATLLTLPFDMLLPTLKTLHENKQPDEIIARALKIRMKTEDLMKLRTEFEKR